MLVIEESGQDMPVGRGLFAEAVLSELPGLPVADEEQLHDEEGRARFLHQVVDYAAAHFGGSG